MGIEDTIRKGLITTIASGFIAMGTGAIIQAVSPNFHFQSLVREVEYSQSIREQPGHYMLRIDDLSHPIVFSPRPWQTKPQVGDILNVNATPYLFSDSYNCLSCNLVE